MVAWSSRYFTPIPALGRDSSTSVSAPRGVKSIATQHSISNVLFILELKASKKFLWHLNTFNNKKNRHQKSKKGNNSKEICPPGLHFWLCFELKLRSLRGLLARSLERSWYLLLGHPNLAGGWRPCLLGYWGRLLGRIVLWLLLLWLLLLLLVSR